MELNICKRCYQDYDNANKHVWWQFLVGLDDKIKKYQYLCDYCIDIIYQKCCVKIHNKIILINKNGQGKCLDDKNNLFAYTVYLDLSENNMIPYFTCSNNVDDVCEDCINKFKSEYNKIHKKIKEMQIEKERKDAKKLIESWEKYIKDGFEKAKLKEKSVNEKIVCYDERELCYINGQVFHTFPGKNMPDSAVLPKRHDDFGMGLSITYKKYENKLSVKNKNEKLL